jgi:hypothetical protein
VKPFFFLFSISKGLGVFFGESGGSGEGLVFVLEQRGRMREE